MRVCVGIACLAALALAIFEWGVLAPINTKYAQPNIQSNFARISVGDSVKHVYTVLGSPLRLHVDPDMAGDGAYRQRADHDVSLSHVSELMKDTNVSVSLIYSDPKTTKLHYLFYYVVVSDAVVERAGGPVEMD